MALYCKHCQQRGHRKWLWLGTHWTHRIYLRYQIRKTIKKYERSV